MGGQVNMLSPGPVLIGTQTFRGPAPDPAGEFKLTNEVTQLENSIRH